MKLFIGAMAVAGALTLPAFAQEAEMDAEMSADTMTCADFMAMDEAGQMEAMTQLEMAMAESQGTEMMTEEQAMTSSQEMMPGTMAACEGNPDMTAMEAMQSGM